MGEVPNPEELRQKATGADVTVDDVNDEEPEIEPPQQEKSVEEQTQVQAPVSSEIENKNTDYPQVLDVTEDLPSRGVLYDYDRIRFRGLIPDEEDKLEGIQSLFEARDIIRQIVQNCVNVDVMDFTYGDLLSMYIWIRIETWNHKYPYSIDCIYCGQPINRMFNLEDLPVEFLEEDYEEPFVVYFGDDEVHLRQIRVSDEKRIEKFIETRSDKYDMNQKQLNIKARRALMVDQAPDVRDTIVDKMDYISDLSTEEYAVIKKFSNDTTHGVGFEVEHKCKNCDESFEAPLPFKPEFIYPDPDDVIDMDDFREPSNA